MIMGLNRVGMLVLAFASTRIGIGCTDEVIPINPPEGDWEGIEEATEALTNLTGRCTVAASTLTCNLVAFDIILFARTSSGTITVNGFATNGATITNTKKIAIFSTGGNVKVMLDFYNGTFAMGAATQPSGISMDLQGASDRLKIRATDQADRYVAGVNGFNLNGDKFTDITVSGAEAAIVFAMLGGNDTFIGTGDAATGNAMFALNTFTIFGGDGNDTMSGGALGDSLNGGNGDDTLDAGDGLVANGNDSMNGDAGFDCVDYSHRTSANGLAPFPVITVTMNGLTGDGDLSAGESDNVKTDVECVKGGPGNDVLTGGANADTIFGNGGNDTIDGLGGNDTLNGGDGDDTFLETGTAAATLPSGADVFNGGAGNDTVDYSSRTTGVVVNIGDLLANDGEANEGDKVMTDVENIKGSSVADTITGSSSANVLDGLGGDDVISGGAGDDTLRGGTGNDVLNGDAGNDLFDEAAASNGSDVFNGGSGIDTMTYKGRADAGEAIRATLDGIADDGQIAGNENDTIAADVENVIGSDVVAVGDIITGNASANQLEGGLGADTITGGGGDDLIDGGGGNDVIDCDDASLVNQGNADINIPDAADTVPALRCEL